MNGADNFAQLESRDPALLSKPSAFERAELEALREFYRAWEALHAIPKDKHHRKQQVEAAMRLTNQMHLLRRMNAGNAH